MNSDPTMNSDDQGETSPVELTNLEKSLSVIIDSLKQQNAGLVKDVEDLVSELCRITLLWDEMWLAALMQRQGEVHRYESLSLSLPPALTLLSLPHSPLSLSLPLSSLFPSLPISPSLLSLSSLSSPSLSLSLPPSLSPFLSLSLLLSLPSPLSPSLPPFLSLSVFLSPSLSL